MSTPAPISSARNPNSATNPNLQNRVEATVLQPPLLPIMDNAAQYRPSTQTFQTTPLRSATQHSASSSPSPNATQYRPSTQMFQTTPLGPATQHSASSSPSPNATQYRPSTQMFQTTPLGPRHNILHLPVLARMQHSIVH